jgi:hypothetical protein
MEYISRAAITTCNNHKFKILTSKQNRYAIGLMFFLATNIWAFETDDNSKITANLEVTGSIEVSGALKVGSLAESTGVVTSTETIESKDNYTTVPTTKSVKAYVDSTTASSSSSSALPSHIVYSDSFSSSSDNEFFTAETGLLTGMKWVGSDSQFMINSSKFNPIPVIELLHSNGSTSVNGSFLVTRLASYLTFTTNPSSGYQYLTGGSAKNSSLDMGIGNVLRVTLTEWGATNYFYEIIVIRSVNVVNVTIRKGGAL